jgi:hypothetical protein
MTLETFPGQDANCKPWLRREDGAASVAIPRRAPNFALACALNFGGFVSILPRIGAALIRLGAGGASRGRHFSGIGGLWSR